jgi:hypothetical protein
MTFQRFRCRTYNTHSRHRTTRKERPYAIRRDDVMFDKLVFREVVAR